MIKDFEIVSPTGEIYNVTHISNFAKEHRLSTSCLSLLRRGKILSTAGGWKLKNKNNIVNKMTPIVQGIGFIGIGKYNSSHPAYLKWSSMLIRVVGNPELSVCDEWLNYQNFAKWYVANFPNDGKQYDLDKDKIDFGNKLYCPEKCSFISREENVRFKKVMYISILIDPNGNEHEVFNQTQFARDNGLCSNGVNGLIKGRVRKHRGWTLKKLPYHKKRTEKIAIS